MANVLIVIGLIMLLLCSILLISYGGISLDCDGPSIKNVSLLLIGLVMFGLWIYLLKRESDSNHKLYEETHSTEIVTSLPPQIDTTIIIKNGVSDTTYTYVFQKQ